MHQNTAEREIETMAAKGHHGPWGLPWPWQHQIPSGCSVFSRLLVFSCGFSSVWAAILPLKWMTLLATRGEFHDSKLINTPRQNFIEEEERRRRGIRWRQWVGSESRDRRSSTSIGFLLLLFLLSFSSFLVRVFDTFNLLVSIMCEWNFQI